MRHSHVREIKTTCALHNTKRCNEFSHVISDNSHVTCQGYVLRNTHSQVACILLPAAGGSIRPKERRTRSGSRRRLHRRRRASRTERRHPFEATRERKGQRS